MHRSQLNETIAALKVRMEAQAKLDDEGALAGALLRSRLLSQGGLTTYSMLAPNPVVSIAMAARRALADVDWDASSEEVCEEREAAARVRSVLNQTEVLECAGMQALMLADGSNGVDADGSLGQCFFCNNYNNCETKVIVCASCICVFHDSCLELRGVQIPEGPPLLPSSQPRGPEEAAGSSCPTPTPSPKRRMIRHQCWRGSHCPRIPPKTTSTVRRWLRRPWALRAASRGWR